MPSGLSSRRPSHDGSVSSGGGGSRRGTEEAPPRPVIHPMPPKPLSLLRQLTGHIKVSQGFLTVILPRCRKSFLVLCLKCLGIGMVRGCHQLVSWAV